MPDGSLLNPILNIKVFEIAPSVLQPNPCNARTHSKQQLRKIEKSIGKFGFINPVIIDCNNVIIAGHGRVAAAIKLGLETIPAIRLEHLTEDQMRAYILADNKLAELAGWDEDILAKELQFLLKSDDLDITDTGFEMPEIDLAILNLDANKNADDKADELPELSPVTITRPGDLWILGDHLLCCCNALNVEAYLRLLNFDEVDTVFTDPPYNVPIQGHVLRRDNNIHEEFAMASGEMDSEEYTGFLGKVFGLIVKYSRAGSIHFVCMDWRHIYELLTAANRHYAECKNLCVWNKNNGGMGSLYRSKHELVFVFKHGQAPHINNIELGKHGRYRTNVWDYAGQTSPHANREEELAMHPTVKPVAMVADALLDCSNRGGIVLDPFGGSGTTLIAAEKTGRCARLIEIDPRYVDVTIRRWQKLTGKHALHADLGETFDSIASGGR